MVHSGAIRNDIFEVWAAEKKINQGHKMVHFGAIWNSVLEVGIAENILKSWTIDDTFWRYFKRCTWSLSWLERIKNKEAKWCILALFETMFCKLLVLKKWKQGGNAAFWHYSTCTVKGILEVETVENIFKEKTINYDWFCSKISVTFQFTAPESSSHLILLNGPASGVPNLGIRNTA